MNTLYPRPANLEDVEHLSTRLRKSDVFEIWASSGYAPLHGLMESFAVSDVCKVACSQDDEPLCMYGTAPVPNCPLAASVWIICGEKLKPTRDFLRLFKSECAIFHRTYPVLYNYLSVANHSSAPWLRWVGGFVVNRHCHFGYAKIPFIEYVLLSESK